MIDIHEDEIRELIVHYKFKERELENLKEDIAIQNNLIKGLRQNNDRLRKLNLELIQQVESNMGELMPLKDLLTKMLLLDGDFDKPTLGKVIELINVQRQRYHHERLSEL